MKTPTNAATRLAGVAGLVALTVGLCLRAPARPGNAGRQGVDAALTPRYLAYRFSPPETSRRTQVRVSEAYGKLPLSFEPNQGQTDRRVNFLARAGAHTLFLNATEAVLILPAAPLTKVQKRWGLFEPFSPAAPEESRVAVPAALRMRVVGANPRAVARGLEPLPGRVSYFIGRDPERWRTDIPTHARVQYDDVYPGVGLSYYGRQGRLEYDFKVRAGTDPSTITLNFSGVDGVELDRNGDLVFRTASEELRHRKPRAFQELNNVRREVSVRYVLRPDRSVGFQLGEYDENRPLLIDPVLAYSTYLGGSSEESGGFIDVDATGNVYLAGATASVDYPTTAASVQPSYGGGIYDAYVTKLNPSGSAVVYSTFLGGSSRDNANGIRVDGSGNVYLAGTTQSSDFPTTPGSFQTTNASGIQQAFVAKLNPAGSVLLYSTFLGGTEESGASGIDVDSSGNAYIAGGARSSFPVTAGSYQTTFGGAFDDAYVAKLNPLGSALVYSTFIGGSQRDFATAIAVDGSGSAYVSVRTTSNLPTSPGAFQPTYGGGSVDAFLIKLTPSGSSAAYATYLGGTGDEDVNKISLDAFGNAYLVGHTCSVDFPTTPGSVQTAFAGGSCNSFGDAFVAKLNPSGSALVYSTFLGGPADDTGTGIVVDNSGAAFVTGLTAGNFPILNAVQSAFGGGPFDAFLAKLNTTGSALLFSTYLGGLGNDGGIALARGPSGCVNVYGNTNSTNFPTVNPLQASNRGGYDTFVVKICDGPIVSNVVATPNPVAVGIAVTLTASITASGGSAVSSAEFSINGGTFNPMSAADGAFDEATENVTANVPALIATGVYTLCVRGKDSALNVGAAECILLPVYDPNGGFVTGGGGVNSPASADLANPSAAGPATFGFVSKYLQGGSTPSGNLEFQFQAGNLNFKSTSMDWLVVTGEPRAIFRGAGTINGATVCKFEVDAWDNSFQPGNVDAFGLKIFSCASGGDRYSLPAAPLTKGSIIIHKQ